jgi:anti-sigma B factor antagonist
MDITKKDLESKGAVISCVGRLNMVNASGVKSAIDDSVREGRPQLVIDLEATTFIDSSGLGALVAGLKAARQAGGDLRVVAPGEQVRTVMRLTNLDRILNPYDSIEDATDGW